MFFLAGVDYEYDCDTAGAADCMPALFLVDHAVRIRYDIGIFEGPRRRFEGNAMFSAREALRVVAELGRGQLCFPPSGLE
jgi:hypothetical protein